jgi:uncharacterized repeat protein (TIGR03847 family)
MSDSFELESPDHFTAGAVGPPGERVFYIQVRQRPTLVTLKCEKEQVRALGDYLGKLLARLGKERETATGDLALLEPVTAAWNVASLGVGYDRQHDRIVVVANEEVEEDSAEEPATARFTISHRQAAGFAERARALMAAGRPTCPQCALPIDPGGHVCPPPPCPLCSLPMDPAGHVCPRTNGHVVRSG